MRLGEFNLATTDDAAADRVRGTVDEYPDFTVEGSLAQ